MTMRIAFNTMELEENRPRDSVGSSRIRANWLINHWPDAELYHIGRKYDAVIFQKCYPLDFMRAYGGIKIFDLCDPDWLQGRPVVEAINYCDAVTTSTDALADTLRLMTSKPVLCIPDRVDLDAFNKVKVHKGRATRALWYGYVDNQKVLDQCMGAIKRLGLKLTVLSNMAYVPEAAIEGIDEQWMTQNLLNLKYDQEYFVDDMINNADIVLNPKLSTGRFKYKSENKTVISWALGLPVAYNSDDLERLMDEGERIKESERRLAEVRTDHDVKLSVQAYQSLIADLQTARAMHGAEQGGY